MIYLRRAPIARILIPFAGGALVGSELVNSGYQFAMVIMGWLIWFVLLVFYLKCSDGVGWIVLLYVHVAFFSYFTAGIGTGMVTRPRNPGLPVGKNVMIEGELLEEAYPGARNWVLKMRVDRVVSDDSLYCTRTNLKAYMQMPVDSILPAAGERCTLYGQLTLIKNSGNPGEPDYEAIMHRMNRWYRFFADSEQPVITGSADPPVPWLRAARIRKTISQKWNGDPEVVSLLKAVCLGDRSGLTDHVRQFYSAAGGMHLLAVSGLHVGLIWWVLYHALGWMVRLLQKEFFRAITILLLLWFYAYITGFSSSVNRSVIMCTIFTLTRMMGRRIHPVNGILVSAFILILVSPGKILDVGFQLSYAAILGISSIYPKIRTMIKVKSKVLKWIWNATAVSLAAQFSTAPLVIYYFHQFPVYSLITNLIAIPLLSCIMGLFVVSVPFISTGVPALFFGGILGKLGALMNRFMEFVASIPGAVITDLYLDRGNLIFILFVLILCMLWLSNRSRLPRYGLLFFISAWVAWSTRNIYVRFETGELVISHISGGSLVTVREGIHVDHYQWLRDSLAIASMDRIKALSWNRRRYKNNSFETTCSDHLSGAISGCEQVASGLWILGNDHIRGWVIADWISEDRLKLVYDHPGEFILLHSEPQLSGPHGFEFTPFVDLVVDGSNRNWYINRMEFRELPIHFTGRRGAYLKRW